MFEQISKQIVSGNLGISAGIGYYQVNAGCFYILQFGYLIPSLSLMAFVDLLFFSFVLLFHFTLQ